MATESGRKAGDDYDPHQFRSLPHPTNNMETFIHLIKCSLGTGILAMPQAFSRSGLILGIIGTVVIGILITHSLQVLVFSEYRICKIKRVPQLPYPEAMRACCKIGPPSFKHLANPGACSVDIFLVTYQLGVCCVYVVFISDNNKKIIDPFYPISLEIHMLIILLPLIILNLIPSLKKMAPFSLLANILCLIGIVIIVYFLVSSKKSSEPDPVEYWGTAAKFPLFFGTTLFALTAVPVVVAVEANMKTPRAFGTPLGVLNLAMTFIVILYVAVGALGYMYCVSDCRDSITLDLPSGPLAITVQAIYNLSILISYALHCYVPVEVIWRNYTLPRLEKRGMSPSKITIANYCLRISLCLFTFVLAMAVPRLGLFISLFGALCLSALGMCIPAIMEICVLYPDKYGPFHMYMIKDIFLFVVGFIGLVAGTYTALLSIVKSFM